MKELNEQHPSQGRHQSFHSSTAATLLHLTTHTVLHNLTEGILLVALILFLFLGNLRGALIVAITIPFCASVRVHLSRPQPHPRQPAFARRARLRHGGRRRCCDGRKHRSPPQSSNATPTAVTSSRRSATPPTRCSGPSSTPSPSSSWRICPSSPCSPSRVVCSSPWPGPSPLPCSDRAALLHAGSPPVLRSASCLP